jgi:hypothetical protein
MKTIRQGVFETNSSSTHSISINIDTELYDSITPDSDGVITLSGGQFGWEWEKYNDALTKANYCAVDCCMDDIKFQMLREVIMEHTGAKNVILNVSHNYDDDNWSYIDHQSVGTAHPAFVSQDQLKNFIFGKKSYLFTGNDNGCPPPNFYDVDKSKFTHKVTLEGSDGEYLVMESDLKDIVKMEEVISTLFSYNEHNEFNSNRTSWSSDDRGIYFTQSYSDPNRGIDIKNKTLTVVQEKPLYKKDGSFDKYRVDKTMVLKYTVKTV